MDDRLLIARERMDCALESNVLGRVTVWHLYRAEWLRTELLCGAWKEMGFTHEEEQQTREVFKLSIGWAEQDAINSLTLC